MKKQRLALLGLLALLASPGLAACSATTNEPATTPVAAPPEAPGDTPVTPPVLREGFVVGDPTAEGIDAVAFAKLVAKAKAQKSEALVVVKNGKLVHEDYYGLPDEPIVAMSASKSFTSLAIGLLLAEGKLTSLDELVTKTLPTFAAVNPRKAKITYRHLLTQTAGLDPTRAGGTKGDIEAHGISVSCVFEPGTSWQYSNNGIDLLAALAGKLAGKSMDKYLNEKLFGPMGIADVDWARDKKGVPLGAGEMYIRPLDMAKVGQAMLDGGKWRGVQIIPQTWPVLSSAQSSTFEPLYGLLWWRSATVLSVGLTNEVIAQWRTAGLAPASASKLQPLVGKIYADERKYDAALLDVLGADDLGVLFDLLSAGNHLPYSRNLEVGPATGFYAAGWLGQFLAVVPEKGIVAVRMRRARPADYDGGREVDGFATFPADLPAIAP